MTYLEFYDLYVYCKDILEGICNGSSVISPGVRFEKRDPIWEEVSLRDACIRIVYIFENAKITCPIIED